VRRIHGIKSKEFEINQVASAIKEIYEADRRSTTEKEKKQ
jgi:hypothetical protein